MMISCQNKNSSPKKISLVVKIPALLYILSHENCPKSKITPIARAHERLCCGVLPAESNCRRSASAEGASEENLGLFLDVFPSKHECSPKVVSLQANSPP